MSTLPEHDATAQPRKKLGWKRWLMVDLAAAAIMTYIEIALLGVLADLIDYEGTGRTVLMILIGIVVYLVNLFVAGVFTVVIFVFISVFGSLFGGDRHSTGSTDKTTDTRRTEP